MEDKKIKTSLSDVTFSSDKHKMIISGCITTIGKPSDGAPCGADGMAVCFSEDAAKNCAGSFVGMPLNCTYPDGLFADGTELFTGHGETNIGYIRDVHIEENKLMAEIVVWKDNFPDEAYMIEFAPHTRDFSHE